MRTTPKPQHRIAEATALLIGIPTIVAGLWLAGQDRILPASVVLLSGAVVVTMLMFALTQGTARPDERTRLQRQRRNSIAIVITGVAMIAAGAIAFVMQWGALPELLLGAGPGVALGGATVAVWAARELKTAQDPA